MTVTMGNTKKASVLLIRKLFLLMQNLDVLPDDVALTMRLYYYDDGGQTAWLGRFSFLKEQSSLFQEIDCL